VGYGCTATAREAVSKIRDLPPFGKFVDLFLQPLIL